MVRTDSLTVAPNGAHLRKSAHSAVPTTLAELVETAKACFDAGAGMIDLHMREDDDSHSLDGVRYRSTIAAIRKAVPDSAIQITTESVGKSGVSEQLKCLREIVLDSASIAVREIARDAKLIKEFYHSANELRINLQHIVYSPKDLDAFLPKVENSGLRWTVCAFEKHEQTCLLAALHAGRNVRIGFENNTTAPDRTVFADDTASVASFIQAAMKLGFQNRGRAA